ncbi:MAG: type II secretion system F family protein [Magnetococcales bacterium]|nr:type II secretion system F family protein [Magnetococcales bacterium]
MARFRFTGRNTQGEAVHGELAASTRDRALEQLVGQGIAPVEVRELQERGGFLSGGGWPSDDDLIQFTRQLYTLMDAGIPVVRAIQGLREGSNNARLKAALETVAADLESGKEIATALGAHPKVFPRLFVSVVRVGETSGKLAAALLQLYQYMEVDKETRQQIKSAMRYPMIVTGAMFVAVFILNWFVIPAFEKLFKQFDAELPWQTRLLVSMSEFTIAHGPVILLTVGVAILAFRRFIRTPDGRLWWDGFKLRLPIVGPIINRATLSRFARTLAMCIQAGLSMDHALNTVAGAMDNARLEKGTRQMRARIDRGEGIHQAAKASGLFTQLVLQMLAVGEETGRTDDMMNSVARFYEREVEYDVKNLATAIEPILLAMMGGMVLMLALGIFMPMWSLGQAVGLGQPGG